jgi:two-component system, sensor histidine kinase
MSERRSDAAYDEQMQRLALELDVPDELSIIASDPTRVRQVVSNLVSNAIKYNSEGGRVLIRVVEEEAPRPN